MKDKDLCQEERKETQQGPGPRQGKAYMCESISLAEEHVSVAIQPSQEKPGSRSNSQWWQQHLCWGHNPEGPMDCQVPSPESILEFRPLPLPLIQISESIAIRKRQHTQPGPKETLVVQQPEMHSRTARPHRQLTNCLGDSLPPLDLETGGVMRRDGRASEEEEMEE